MQTCWRAEQQDGFGPEQMQEACICSGMLGGTKQSCFVCRSLGVHCSKVRSLTLDSWEPELLKVRAEASKGSC